MKLNRSSIRLGIVAFWAIWFSVVAVTNSCDGLKAMGLLKPGWTFASGNYEYMRTVTARYAISRDATGPLFLAVVGWEIVATLLFARAAILLHAGSMDARSAFRFAFASGLGLWASFAIADEIFIAYSVEGTHLQLFIAQLLSLFYVEQTSDEASANVSTDA